MIAPVNTIHELTHDEIALEAYLLWERNGRPSGQEQTFWSKAEAGLLGRYSKLGQPTSLPLVASSQSEQAVESTRVTAQKKAPTRRASGEIVAKGGVVLQKDVSVQASSSAKPKAGPKTPVAKAKGAVKTRSGVLKAVKKPSSI